VCVEEAGGMPSSLILMPGLSIRYVPLSTNAGRTHAIVWIMET
jgi:hypothetical protein